MNDKEVYGNFVTQLLTSISEVYWTRMVHYIKENNIDHKDVNCFILNPESMAIYVGQKYIALEYCGNPYKNDFNTVSKYKIMIRDLTKENLTTKQFIDRIVGFSYDGTSNISLQLDSGVYENLVIPTNDGITKLIELNWNFAAQNNIMSFNSVGIDIPDNQFVRLINCRFFDEQNGDLKTRIIKWIDFIPCYYNEPEEGEVDEIGFNYAIYDKLWYNDMFYKYPQPNDYKFNKLPQINRFIEIFLMCFD